MGGGGFVERSAYIVVSSPGVGSARPAYPGLASAVGE